MIPKAAAKEDSGGCQSWPSLHKYIYIKSNRSAVTLYVQLGFLPCCRHGELMPLVNGESMAIGHQIHDQSMANKHQINAKHTNNHGLNGKFSVLKLRIWRSTC